MKKFTVHVRVIMPDGKIGIFPALGKYPGAVDGKNPALPAEFNTKVEAQNWADFCLCDKTEIKETDETAVQKLI